VDYWGGATPDRPRIHAPPRQTRSFSPSAWEVAASQVRCYATREKRLWRECLLPGVEGADSRHTNNRTASSVPVDAELAARIREDRRDEIGAVALFRPVVNAASDGSRIPSMKDGIARPKPSASKA
jgi:hypothetical protein